MNDNRNKPDGIAWTALFISILTFVISIPANFNSLMNLRDYLKNQPRLDFKCRFIKNQIKDNRKYFYYQFFITNKAEGDPFKIKSLTIQFDKKIISLISGHLDPDGCTSKETFDNSTYKLEITDFGIPSTKQLMVFLYTPNFSALSKAEIIPMTGKPITLESSNIDTVNYQDSNGLEVGK